MNKILLSGLNRGLASKHTSGAAIVYIVAKYGAMACKVWFPQHSEQFDKTADIIEGAAVAYGLYMAGDSPAPSSKTANKSKKKK